MNRLEMRDRFLAVMRAEHAKRPERQGDPGEWPPPWLQLEIDAMHEEVNRLRSESGRGPVDRVEVERIEISASGHVDYGQKFALRCAELVERAP